jgi:uncharacterized protein YdhG (YjbR/CyaY superfamily)
MPADPKIEAFFDRVSPDQRGALAKLRGQIRKAAPKAEEVFSYGVPIFKLDDKSLVGMGAAKTHCSFYVMSPKVIAAEGEALDKLGHRYSPGNIQFAPDKPLPAAMVARIVKARIAENAAMKAASAAKAKARKKK